MSRGPPSKSGIRREERAQLRLQRERDRKRHKFSAVSPGGNGGRVEETSWPKQLDTAANNENCAGER